MSQESRPSERSIELRPDRGRGYGKHAELGRPAEPFLLLEEVEPPDLPDRDGALGLLVDEDSGDSALRMKEVEPPERGLMPVPLQREPVLFAERLDHADQRQLELHGGDN
jgi:hypothetical protein